MMETFSEAEDEQQLAARIPSEQRYNRTHLFMQDMQILTCNARYA